MNKKMIAAGGSIGIANGCVLKGNRIVKFHFPKKVIIANQVIEYLRAFFMGRQGWNRMGGCMLISGAFGLFDKKRVVQIGGYKREIGDDVDLVFRLHREMREKKEPYEIRMIPDLTAMTEAPFTLEALGNQRERWQRGLITALWDNKIMMFNPKYGLNGMLGYPYFAIIEAISPIIETVGYFIVALSFFWGVLNAYAAMWFLLLALCFPMVLSLFVILLQYVSFQWYFSLADTFKMVGCSIIEQLGFRQYLVFYRLCAFYNWIKGKGTWKKIEREGFKESKD
jgi:cellulose synthase/poly-beta-1,6-N-acetylglucosamine synthase-like glycosyltransferase